MGNDGGTIIKGAKKAAPTAAEEQIKDENHAALTTCAISSLSLKGDIVVCDKKGRLYLKHRLLQAIIDKKTKVKFKNTRPANIQWTTDNEGKPQVQCALTNDSSTTAFACLDCGCVMAVKALERIAGSSDPQTCPNCNEDLENTEVYYLGSAVTLKKKTPTTAYKVTKPKKLSKPAKSLTTT
ncbi:hypothetical protein DICA3_E23882 [Diutina catenulata]